MRWISDGALSRLRELADVPDFTGTRYRLEGEIARGGMGTVYLARDIELDREIAIKVLNPGRLYPEMAARMLREARIIAGLEHPGIVPVHDVGTTPDGRVFYAMKLVRGLRLDEFAARATTQEELLRTLKAVCDAVAFAHAHGVIHRDLKPENIMVGAFGEVLVMDWGVARILDAGDAGDAGTRAADRSKRKSNQAENHLSIESQYSAVTADGVVIGTPGFMAPEQELGEGKKVDERTDVYALGAILHFLLTGRNPVAGAAAWNHISEKPLPLRRGKMRTRAIRAVCLKALAADPSSRYSDASAFAADITSFLEGGSVTAYRESALEKAGRWASNNRFILLLIAAYLAMRVALLFFSGR
jgi:serine/threonine protein kinase